MLFGLEHGPAGDAVAVSMNFHIAAVVALGFDMTYYIESGRLCPRLCVFRCGDANMTSY